MKQLYDTYSLNNAKLLTRMYSTSFSSSVRLLAPSIRPHIYNIYGFVRLADEIVDSFHDYDKKNLLDQFEQEYYNSLDRGLSINPVIHSFQNTKRAFNIDDELVSAFLKSMRADLKKTTYQTVEEINEYIYGSADVVGLMCLKIFVNGNEEKYNALKYSAEKLGSAFQKVNFLRDLRNDFEQLNRSYFPNVNLDNLSPNDKEKIVQEIRQDFDDAYAGIIKLPIESRLGVYVAYRYYRKLLCKLERTPCSQIMSKRIRVSDPMKFVIVGKSYIRNQLNIL